MKKKEIWQLIIVGLIVLAVLSVIFVTIAIVTPPKRTTKAQKYDLECVAGRSRNPLVECKE